MNRLRFDASRQIPWRCDGRSAFAPLMLGSCFVTGLVLAAPLAAAATGPADSHLPERNRYLAPLTAERPRVDGIADEASWDDADWHALDQRWLGPEFTSEDFSGRFKITWHDDRIYLLVEIVDDILIDSHRDPLVQYWDDDCLEIFIDEDRSGGNHQFTHNAFAYHLALDNRAIDIGTDRQARDYSHHVESRWRQYSDRLVWEVSLDVYADDYADTGSSTPVSLERGKVIGFMLAYCDNDGSPIRENFVGSEAITSGPTDRGWIDAGVFGELVLVGAKTDA